MSGDLVGVSPGLNDVVRRLVNKGGLLVGTGGGDIAEQLAPGADGAFLTADATARLGLAWSSGGIGTGTVTSVDLAVPADETVSGGPITTLGTLTITRNAQSGNKVLASPSDGSSGTPAFRALAAADLPLHHASHQDGGSDEVATATPAAAAIPKADGSGKLDTWVSDASTSTKGKVQLATTSSDTTAGHAVQASDARLSDSRAPTGSAGGDFAGTYPNPTIGVMTTRGDLLTRGASATARLAVGANQTILTSNGTDPAWSAAPTLSGEVTASDFKASGLTGATAASRYIGGTASGAPVAGTFAVGDAVVDQTGKLFICTSAGTPGTWVDVSSARIASSLMTTRGDLIYENATPTPARLAIGSAGQVLRARTDPTWEDQTIDINFVIDGGGAVITTGMKGYLQINQTLTVVAATLLADQSGSIVVDVFKCTYSAFDAGSTHPVSGDKITASAPPTISSTTKATDSTLTGWTTAIAAGDVLAFNVNSITTCQRVTLCLKCKKA